MGRRLPQPMADESLVQALLERTRGGATLGDLITFGVSGVEITPEALRELLLKRGIESWYPVDIKPQTAARKAIGAFKPAIERSNIKVMVRTAHEDASEIRYTIVGERRSASEKNVRYSQVNQVIFDKRTGDLSFTGEPIEPILKLYERLCQVYTSRELVLMTKNILRGYGGLPLKVAGGLWFLPAVGKDLSDALRTFYNKDLGALGNAHFRTIGVQSGDDARGILGSAIYQELDQEVREILEAVRNATKRGNANQLSGLRQRIRIVQGKAEIYRPIVDMDLDFLQVAFDDARKALTEQAQHAERKLIGSSESSLRPVRYFTGVAP
jgi:hypothetical protein